MAKNIKYVPSGGLLLSEEKDMKKLSKLAKEGWMLESFEKLSYKLIKSEPEDIEYCVDYNEDKDDWNEYISLFENSDWEYICSYEGYHFFKAPKGTKPIYTDKETLSLKYEKQYKLMKKSIIGTVVLILACILGIGFISMLNNGSNTLRGLKIVLSSGVGAGIGILIPFIICAVIAYKKIEN
ncbi:DUF2812 domain-containing protein [Terrisporobacter mayombei]|uniref:DUF2812 domain-containing protein n=1 Tax=Terrisporobacter mayombei TaxID=1541 RepID=A0ABY9Q630_9FIRM|nr:DUF2812 domain-containing protein [Terrisporobacter mayombei]MCC3869198.1 DUF2812 domain-containing protein [Terrisporobacter mayombei]WMT82665.1 hypothetical protein TEMA_31530 [Terrisporobacter mayombei]